METVAAVRAWTRVDLRRRWRSLAVLALLVAVSAATVLTAVAGSVRAESALERLQARTLPATAAVLPNQPGFDWEEVRALPEVESVGLFALSGTNTVLEGPAAGAEVFFPLANDEIARTLERPLALTGRLADPARSDEVMVSPRFVETFGLGVGDTVSARLFTPAQQKKALQGPVGPPGGPVVPLRIVGVVRSTWFSDTPGRPGGMVTTHAFFQRYRENLLGEPVIYNALVRLGGGEEALPAFRAGLARVSGRTDIDVWNLPDQARGYGRTISFEARCLLAFGAAALLAALVLVGQAVSRFVGAAVEDLQVLRALGLTPRQAVACAGVGPTLAAVAGSTAGVGAAILASRWFPIGLAAYFEPDPGIDVDPAVLATGWVVVPLLVAAGSVAAAWLALGATRRSAPERRSSVATAAARAGLPVPVVVGTRFALEAGRGRTAVPVRPALLGAVTGVLGVIAALTFSTGVADAAANPARYGQTHQLEAFLGTAGQDFGPVGKMLAAVAQDPDVIGVNDTRVAVAESAADGTPVTLFSLTPVGRPVDAVVTSGRVPQAADEVVLGPTSATALGVGVGDVVELRGSRPGQVHRMTVTGVGFVPIGPHNGYANGGWVTTAGYDRLFTDFKYHVGIVAVRDGADPQALLARVNERAARAAGGQGPPFSVAQPPIEMAVLKQVQVLPLLLGVFLAVLAVGAVGHALATAVRRRRHDLAVLRALGMTRWQTRGVVVTHATVLAVVGLVFGVPLGMALGRTVWRSVADYTPLQYEPPLAFWALLLVGPVAVLVSNLLAAWPGRTAARLRIGHVLRAE